MGMDTDQAIRTSSIRAESQTPSSRLFDVRPYGLHRVFAIEMSECRRHFDAGHQPQKSVSSASTQAAA